MNVAVVLLCAVALVAQSPRWLRVAQREHYLAGSTTRFAVRWWRAQGANLALVAVAAAACAAAVVVPEAALVTAVIVVVAPLGLSLRGRTSALAWTRRLRVLSVVVGVLDVAIVAVAVALGRPGVALAALACLVQPAIVDLGLLFTAPFERRSAKRFVQSAEAKLRAAAPVTVAITGSYGKTSTKQYAGHLISGSRSVLASPASFNNTGGLSRTLNDHLVSGTEVFIAEMGTYGPGEIADLCSWVRPDIGAIVNIGPVHLERMGSLDGIVAAKAEILADVRVAVLNVTAYGLAAIADDAERRGLRVVRVATEPVDADVVVSADDAGACVIVGGREVGRVVGPGFHAANVATAVGIALALDLPIEAIAARLATLPVAEHRQEVQQSAAGVTVIDNTFSSNPASGVASLALLERLRAPGRRAAVVTPGMVELGPVQADENTRFAARAATLATDLIVVGRTNRPALDRGAAGGAAAVHHMSTRSAAADWVRATLTDGDVVLYENDLPDHYP